MKKEIAKLQGTWKVTALEVEGQKMDPGVLAEGKIIVAGDSFVSLGMGATYVGKLKIDDSTSPKSLDMVFTEGPEKGNTNFGIYEHLDDDTWRICLDTRGASRPKKFGTKPNTGLALETLKLESRTAILPKGEGKSKAAKSTAPPEGLVPAPELEGEWAMVSVIANGQTVPEQYLKSGKRIAKNNHTVAHMGGQVILEAHFTVDRTQTPNAMDYFLKDGARQYAIYDLDGKILKICSSPAGKPRPTDFESKSGDGRTYTVWRLEKK